MTATNGGPVAHGTAAQNPAAAKPLSADQFTPAAAREAAHGYRAFGLAPLRLRPWSKVPAEARWTAAAPLSGADIEETWPDGGPASNVGIRTGAASGGVLVLDEDAPGALDALDADLDGALSAAPTREHRTPRGGRHWFYRAPAGVRLANSVGRLWPGVDVRGDGGQVVAPPSRTERGTYVVACDAPVADAPAVLLERLAALAAPAPVEVSDAEPGVVAFADAEPGEQRRREAYCASVVARVVADLHAARAWPVGHRPDGRGWEKVTADAARSLLALVVAPWAPLGEQEAVAAFVGAAPTDAGWTRADLRRKWLSERAKARPARFPAPDADWLALPEERVSTAAPDLDGTPTLDGAPDLDGVAGGGEAPDLDVSPEDPGEGEEPEAGGFWAERPVLTHLRDFARARMASPWAVLGCALVLAADTVPPRVVLPPTVGGVGSPNLFVGLVGPSGGGKGAAEAAAADALDFGADAFRASIGSGEGLAHVFAHRERGEVVRDRDAAVLAVPEVDSLAALGARQGATLLPALRSAWSGERLGFGYSDPAKRVPVEPHSYRLGLVLGVQPARAGALLEDADGGTPQRFVWLPVLDGAIPEETPPEPARWGVPVSPWPAGGQHRMAVPAEAVETMRAAARARHRGEVDALDGHALLCRLKVAAALAVLDGRHGVTDDDWRLAGRVMERSDATRASVATTLRQQRARSLHAAALERGTADDVAHVAQGDRAALRLAGAILRRLSRREPTPWADARRALASRDRPHFEDAVALLVEHQAVEVVEAPGGRRLVATGRGRALPRAR